MFTVFYFAITAIVIILVLVSEETRKIIAACAVSVVLFITGFAFLPDALADEYEVYPKAAVIKEINIFTESIILEDGEGFLWEVYSVFDEGTDINLGDIVALLMWNAGTTNIEDDEVIDIVFEHFKAQP